MNLRRSHVDWFERSAAYGHIPKEVRSIGEPDVAMIRNKQPPGLYLRAGAPELTLQLFHSPTRGVADQGNKWTAEAVRAGDFTLAPADTALSYETFESFEATAFIIPQTMIQSALGETYCSVSLAKNADFGLLHRGLFRDATLVELVTRLWQEAKHGLPLGRLFADAGWTSVISLLALSAFGLPVREHTRGGLASWQLRRVHDAIEAQLDGDVSLRALADIAGCSPTHFSRAFKRSTGVPPFAWLLNRRIERGKELLADPRVSLAEVALAVGFSAQPQFTTAFRRVTGMTPGAWRRERLL